MYMKSLKISLLLYWKFWFETKFNNKLFPFRKVQHGIQKQNEMNNCYSALWMAEAFRQITIHEEVVTICTVKK